MMTSSQMTTAIARAHKLKSGRYRLMSWTAIARLVVGGNQTPSDLERFVERILNTSPSR